MKDTLKGIGSWLLVICIFAGIIFLVTMLVKGGVWLGERVYPWLVIAFTITLFLSILILLPLAIFRRTRAFSGAGLFLASFVFGLTLWVWSLLTSYTLWGIGGIVAGLLLGGIGVVPIAILASLFKGMWSMVGQLLLVTAITFGTRLFATVLIENAERHNSSSGVDLEAAPVGISDSTND